MASYRACPLSLWLAARRLFADCNGSPLGHVPGELDCIPVREPDAAVRAPLANGLRIGRAVDAVAFGGKCDPHQADWIIGPRRKVEGLLYIDAAQIERRVVVIGGIFGNARD